MPDFISLEIIGEHELEVHGDPPGLRRLAAMLLELADRSTSGPEHDHLATAEWAGSELSSETQGSGRVVHQVKIICWPGRERV